MALTGQTWCLPALGQSVSRVLQRSLPYDELWLGLTDVLKVLLQQVDVVLGVVSRVLPHPQSLGDEELPGICHVSPCLPGDQPSLLFLWFCLSVPGPALAAPASPARHPSLCCHDGDPGEAREEPPHNNLQPLLLQLARRNAVQVRLPAQHSAVQ